MKSKLVGLLVMILMLVGCGVQSTDGEAAVSTGDAVPAWRPPDVVPIGDCQTMAWIDLYLALPDGSDFVAYPTWRIVGPFAPATVVYESERIENTYAKAAGEMWVPEGVNLDPCTGEGCPGDAFVRWDEMAREMPDCSLEGKPEEDVFAMEVGTSIRVAHKRMYVVPLFNGAALERFDGEVLHFADGGQMKLSALLEGMRVESGLEFVPGNVP